MDANGNRWDYHGNQDNTGGGDAAAFDKNSAKVSGMVERFDVVNTKTGTPMIRFALRCWRERIQVVAFKELATTTLLRPGERVEVEGRIQGTQWSAPDGSRRTGFQIVARAIRPEQTASTRRIRAAQGHSRKGEGDDMDGRQRRLPGTPSAWSKDRPGVMVYQGGPF